MENYIGGIVAAESGNVVAVSAAVVVLAVSLDAVRLRLVAGLPGPREGRVEGQGQGGQGAKQDDPKHGEVVMSECILACSAGTKRIFQLFTFGYGKRSMTRIS